MKVRFRDMIDCPRHLCVHEYVKILDDLYILSLRRDEIEDTLEVIKDDKKYEKKYNKLKLKLYNITEDINRLNERLKRG